MQSPSSFPGTKKSTLLPAVDRRIVANFIFLDNSEVLSQGRQSACAALPPFSLKWFLPTQAQSTWLCSLLISNLSFPSSSGLPLSPGISGGQAAPAEPWYPREAGQGSNILETVMFVSFLFKRWNTVYSCVWDRLFFLLLQSYSNRLKVSKNKKRKKTNLPALSNTNRPSMWSMCRLCVSFPQKPAYISFIHDSVFLSAVYSFLLLVSK